MLCGLSIMLSMLRIMRRYVVRGGAWENREGTRLVLERSSRGVSQSTKHLAPRQRVSPATNRRQHPRACVLSCILYIVHAMATAGRWGTPPSQVLELHPWYKLASRKRKVVSSSSEEDSDASAEAMSSRTKRRRCAALENGLEGLSIGPDPYIPRGLPCHPDSFDFPPPRYSFPPPRNMALMELEHELTPPVGVTTVITASSVEEPTSPAQSADRFVVPDAPEIRMRSSSWYEPEKDRTCHPRACTRFNTHKPFVVL